MSDTIKLLMMGVGYQGRRAVVMAHELGYELVGVADPGQAGKKLRDVADNASLPDLTVHATVDEAIAAGGKPDVIMMSVGAAPEVVVDITCEVVKHGISIVTLTEELFEGLGPLAEKVDAAAKAHGASVIPTGLQDLLWVQLPSVAASMVQNIRSVTLNDQADCTIFSEEIANEEAGVGFTPEVHAEWKSHRIHQQPIQGAPLRELARRMNLTPLEFDYQINPVLAKQETFWDNGNRNIPAGHTIGTEYVVSFDTKEGVKFSGILQYSLAPGTCTFEGACANSYVMIEGDNDIKVHTPNVPADMIPMALVRRVPDALAAAPGLVRSSTLPNCSYQPSIRK